MNVLLNWVSASSSHPICRWINRRVGRSSHTSAPATHTGSGFGVWAARFQARDLSHPLVRVLRKDSVLADRLHFTPSKTRLSRAMECGKIQTTCCRNNSGLMPRVPVGNPGHGLLLGPVGALSRSQVGRGFNAASPQGPSRPGLRSWSSSGTVQGRRALAQSAADT